MWFGNFWLFHAVKKKRDEPRNCCRKLLEGVGSVACGPSPWILVFHFRSREPSSVRLFSKWRLAWLGPWVSCWGLSGHWPSRPPSPWLAFPSLTTSLIWLKLTGGLPSGNHFCPIYSCMGNNSETDDPVHETLGRCSLITKCKLVAPRPNVDLLFTPSVFCVIPLQDVRLGCNFFSIPEESQDSAVLVHKRKRLAINALSNVWSFPGKSRNSCLCGA